MLRIYYFSQGGTHVLFKIQFQIKNTYTLQQGKFLLKNINQFHIIKQWKKTPGENS